MTFIETIPEDEAQGAVAEMYELDRERFGELPNFTQAFSHRPDVYAAWVQLNTAVKSHMDPRRYELASVAAARRLRSSYCLLAHGSVLVSKLNVEPQAVQAMASDHRSADLEPVDEAVMDLADKVADDAPSVTQADVDRLRELGLSDPEIVDVVLAAAVRAFFSKTIEALGAEPDPKYAELEPGLRDTLTVGRAIARS
jgi:uncharacterized peroxidase-related enzyme